MKKPEGVHCWHCRYWFWYGACCSVHTYNEYLDIDPMVPESIEDCKRFELKLHSERGAEHYDPLPPLEIVELVRKLRNTEYTNLIYRIQNSEAIFV